MTDKFNINPHEEPGTRERQEVKQPPLYRVFLINDDYTTMEFVVHILEKVFHKTSVEAVQIMLHVHKNGKGLAGTYIREIAETKAAAVIELSRKRHFPLQCTMERQ